MCPRGDRGPKQNLGSFGFPSNQRQAYLQTMHTQMDLDMWRCLQMGTLQNGRVSCGFPRKSQKGFKTNEGEIETTSPPTQSASSPMGRPSPAGLSLPPLGSFATRSPDGTCAQGAKTIQAASRTLHHSQPGCLRSPAPHKQEPEPVLDRSCLHDV